MLGKFLDAKSLSYRFGNTFVIPYNYDGSKDNDFLEQKTIYNSIHEECPFPAGIK